MKQINNRISDRAKAQLDELAEIFESQRVALEIAIRDAYAKHLGESETDFQPED